MGQKSGYAPTEIKEKIEQKITELQLKIIATKTMGGAVLTLGGLAAGFHFYVKWLTANGTLQLLTSVAEKNSYNFFKRSRNQLLHYTRSKNIWTAALVGTGAILVGDVLYLISPSDSQEAKVILNQMLDAMINQKNVTFTDVEIAQAKIVLDAILK